MKNKIVSYQKEQFSEDILKRFNKAYCSIFNVPHFLIHPVTGHIVGLKTVFGTENVPFEKMYSAQQAETYLKEGYVFYHHPDVTLKRIMEKCFGVDHKPYLSLLLDTQGNILGFIFGVDYPSFFEMLFHEGWLDRFHYSNFTQHVGYEPWLNRLRSSAKLISNINEALTAGKNLFSHMEDSNPNFKPNGRVFSPNALGVFRNFRHWKTLLELNLSLRNELDAETKSVPFVFETTVGTRTHDFFIKNGWIIVKGSLADPFQEKHKKGDSVVTVGSYTLSVEKYVPEYHTESATYPA